MGRLSTFILLSITLYSIFSQVGAAPSGGVGGDNSKGELVDIKANLVFPHKVNDTLSVLCLVGDFAAQHNGAVITADSAVRYEDERLECFGNVLINKNTTYAYCDRADYDSANNLATLYSQLVKVVDEDVTLYTYNFEFNTLDNIGKYWRGGVTMKLIEPEPQGDSLDLQIVEIEPAYDIMESVRGYYYADDKKVIGVQNVQLKGDGYQMIGDSVIYEMESERAIFFGATDIWNEDEDYIYGDAGLYDKARGLYSVTDNGYLLTKEQEVWGDSLEYYRDREEAILRRNIQIIDTTHKSIAFGDYGRYWGKEERILMTRNPLLINYDTQQPEQPVDSLFLRGDTLEVISYVQGTGPFTDSLKMAAAAAEIPDGFSEMMEEEQPQEEHDHDHAHDHDHDHRPVDSLADASTQSPITDSLPAAIMADTLPSKSELKAIARKEKEAARITALEAREFRKLEQRRDKLIGKIEQKREKAKNIYSDSMTLLRITGDIELYLSKGDTLKQDTISSDLTPIEPDSLASTTEQERDSLYRVFIGYGNVRSYRSDFQMVCDSMVSNSYDTVMTLYTKPIIWSGKNQITALEKMDFYTRDGDLDYADFFGEPIMAALVIEGDTTYINQVKGKDMRAFFENNNVTRNDVNSNVQTIYYMQDDETLEVNTIAYIESGSATFLIEDQELDGVIYRQQPVYTFAPLDRKPADIPFFLDGFKWESDLRPTRSDIMDRTIRASIREEKSALERPTFPILEVIERDRAEFEKRGSWVDRMELVNPDAVEWMESLGFTPGQPRPEGSTF
ncbi:MAG: OstA-like protein [Rikenellaceae bacterium]